MEDLVKWEGVCSECNHKETLMITADQKAALRKCNIQDVLPNVSPNVRELMISGVCGKCFDELFFDNEADDTFVYHLNESDFESENDK